ncbi:hypothetical protein B9G55_00630 [Saccharibacillus sp. O16]|nr:hypothetical protein B9G55_00630 [Saccharibacillus sp. O16]
MSLNTSPNSAGGKGTLYPLWALAGFLYGAMLAVGSGQVMWTSVLPILLLTLLLDLFPIRLISGDEFAAGLIGFLALLIGFGLYTALLGVFISSLSNEARQSGFRLRAFDPVRWIARVGIYTLSTCGAALALQGLHEIWPGASLYVQAAVAALAFKAVKVPMAAGLRKVLTGTSVLAGIRGRLRETLVPILLCIAVIPHFLSHVLEEDSVYELAYTGLFLFFILYFSNVYLREVTGWRRTYERFSQLFESRLSSDLEGHGMRTGAIADCLADRLSYPREKKRVLVQTAIQHDVGKSALPAYLFNKRGALSLSEEDEYRSHSEKGAEIIFTLTEDERTARWVRHHHERWDGRGFPDGLKGKDIPYESRLLALCSRMDHLLRREADDEALCEQVRKLSGRELDPELASVVTIHFVHWLREQLFRQGLAGAAADDLAATRIEPGIYGSSTAAFLPDKEEHDEEAGDYVGRSIQMKFASDGLLYGGEEPALEPELIRMARRAEAEQKSFYELLTHEGRTYEAHFYPGHGEVSIVFTDITPAYLARQQLRDETRLAYREVILALSEGKVQLCRNVEEVQSHLGQPLAGLTVAARTDIARSRDLAASFMPQENPKRLMQVKLAVSEAATNLLKHALGGEVTVFAQGSLLQVLVRDEGSGIALHELPKTFVASGYSSKRSLGRGFSVMYASANRIFVYTDSKGTQLLLEFEGREGAAQPTEQSQHIPTTVEA